MSEKLCIFCKHITFDVRGGYWCQDDTGGDEAEAHLVCGKRHFHDSGLGWEGVKWIRESIVRAETCPDYEPDK